MLGTLLGKSVPNNHCVRASACCVVTCQRLCTVASGLTMWVWVARILYFVINMLPVQCKTCVAFSKSNGMHCAQTVVALPCISLTLR